MREKRLFTLDLFHFAIYFSLILFLMSCLGSVSYLANFSLLTLLNLNRLLSIRTRFAFLYLFSCSLFLFKIHHEM